MEMEKAIRFLIDFIGFVHGQAVDAPTDQMIRWADMKAKHQGKQICCYVGDPEDIFTEKPEKEPEEEPEEVEDASQEEVEDISQKGKTEEAEKPDEKTLIDIVSIKKPPRKARSKSKK